MIRNLLDVASPDRWVDCDEYKYPSGGNPWTELYTEQVCKNIAAKAAISDPAAIKRLRFQLAATAEYLTASLGFVGGAATLTQKHIWADKLDISLRRVLAQLDDATDHLSTVLIKGNGDKAMVHPASEMRRRVERTRDAITDLRLVLGAVEKPTEKVGGGTNHAQTLQLVVDAMTEVFIDICSVPDDHISPRRSALFMARWVLRECGGIENSPGDCFPAKRDGVRPC